MATNIINLGSVSATGVFLELETSGTNGTDLYIDENAGGSTILVETSPDNSVWTAYTGGFSNNASGNLVALGASTFSSKGNYFFPTTTKYIRWSISSYVSGSLNYRYTMSTGNNSDPVEVIESDGFASYPVTWMRGKWFSGGTASTTKPAFLIEPAGTPSTNWNVNGTGLGVNAPNGFTGNIFDYQVNGVSKISATPSGSLYGADYVKSPTGFYVTSNVGTLYFGVSPDLALTRRAAANLQLGGADVAAPIAQTLTAQSVVAGTSNTAAPNLTIQAPAGTGTGLGGTFKVQVAPASSSGSTVNAWVDAMTIDSTKLATFAGPVKTLVTTVSGLPAAATAGVGSRAFVTDATVSTFASTVVGGGAVKVPVYSDGTNWLIG